MRVHHAHVVSGIADERPVYRQPRLSEHGSLAEMTAANSSTRIGRDYGQQDGTDQDRLIGASPARPCSQPSLNRSLLCLAHFGSLPLGSVFNVA